MSILSRRAFSWLRSFWPNRRFESGMDDEIRFHIEQELQAGMLKGLSEKEAYRRARLHFGDIESHKHEMRSAFKIQWVADILSDLSYAVRIFRKSPGFTTIAIGSIALAIGANTAVFSLANQMLFERLAVPDADQLRLFTVAATGPNVVHSSWGHSWTEGGMEMHNSVPYPIFKQLQKNDRAMQQIAGFKGLQHVSATVDGEPRSIQAQFVSGNFYGMMQVQPELGRELGSEDDNGGTAGLVAVISHGFWMRAFNGSTSVVGRTVTMNNNPVTIVGVNPSGFTGAEGVERSPEVFLPLSDIGFFQEEPSEDPLTSSTNRWWVEMIARSRQATSNSAAEQELSLLLRAAILSMTTPKRGEQIPHVLVSDGSHGSNEMGNFYSKSIYVMLGMVGLVLLLACANLANLLLARAVTRKREMSVRLALGAGRSRLLRQVLTEGLLLSFAGGAIGLVFGYLSRAVIPSLLENEWLRGDLNVPFNWHIFAFVAAIILFVGVLFSLLPALRSSRVQANVGLKETERTMTRRRNAWTAKGLVSFQIALSTLLVIGSALFVHTLLNLNRVSTGFEVPGIVQFQVVPPSKRYKGKPSTELMSHIEDQVKAIPGVEGVTLSEVPLLAGSTSDTDFMPEGAPKHEWTRGDDSQSSSFTVVGQDFFSVLKIPIVNGRPFGSQDTPTAPRVAVINQAAADHFFPKTNPIGRRFSTGDGKDGPEWFTVIGICANTLYSSMRKKPETLHFDLMRQSDDAYGATFMVRTSLPLKTLGPMLRKSVALVDRDLPITRLQTFQDQVDEQLGQERLFASLAAGFGVLALALACIGVYGVMAYSVSQRTQEIGVRLAFGARRSQVRGMMLSEAIFLGGAGVGSGIIATIILERVVKSMLFGIPPHDITSMVFGTTTMLIVALLACWIPATRASRIEPMVALRHE